MACKYKIILRTGEVIELPSSLNDRSEFSFQEFRKVLKNLDREQLDKLFEIMINAKNVPLSVQGVNLDKVIKTSSLNQILNNGTKNFFKNEISSELYQTAKGLITTLAQVGEDINANNVIYTDTYDLFNPNYGNAYDLNNNTFIINSNIKNDINFISLNKALIDIFILKHSNNLKELIESKYSNVQEFLENLPILYQKNVVPLDIITAIKQGLNLSDNVFDYIYSNTTKAEKTIKVYEGKTVDDFKLYARVVYNNYKNLIDTKEARAINYTPSQYTGNYPSLKVGDLIKTNVGLKQGKFGVYLDEFNKTVNGVETKFYVVLITSNDGNTYDWKTIPETDLKFKNPNNKELEFVIKKQLDVKDTLDIDLNNVSNKSNIIQNPLTITTKSKQETDDLLKIAKEGDKVTIEYGVDSKIKQSVKEIVAVKGTKIYLKSIVGKKAVITDYFIKDLNISKVTLDLDNHENLNSFQDIDYLNEAINKNLMYSPIEVNEFNREEIINNLNAGDVIYTLEKGDEKSYYYLGKSGKGINVSVDEDGDPVVRTKEIDKTLISKIIYNVENKQNYINDFNSKIEIIKDSVNTNLFANNTKEKSTPKLSTYKIIENSQKSQKLKQNLIEGEFVEIDNKQYVVLENKNGNLKLYGESGLTQEVNESIQKVIKNTPELSPYTGKILDMNTPLILDSGGINDIFDSDMYSEETGEGKVKVNYVISKDVPIVWEEGEVKQGFFIEASNFNDSLYKNLSNDYAAKNIRKGVELYGYKKDGMLLTNTKNTTEFNVYSMSSSALFYNLIPGAYIQFKGNDRIFRIEEKLDDGFIIEYAFKDNNGEISVIQEFIADSKLNSVNPDFSNSLSKIFIPNSYTQTIESFKNYKETLNKRVKQEISGENTQEIMHEIVSHLTNSFGIPVINKSTLDLNSDLELEVVKNKDSAKAFLFNGKIYLNSDNSSLDSPLHESLHLILGTLKVLNPKLYEQILVNMKQNVEDLEEVKNNYPYLTNYEMLEELFVTTLSKHIASKLENEIFESSLFLDSINESINELLQLDNSTDTNTLLNSSISQLLNEFGSKYINNPQSLYDIDASNLSNKITNVKAELLKNKNLKEKCK